MKSLLVCFLFLFVGTVTEALQPDSLLMGRTEITDGSDVTSKDTPKDTPKDADAQPAKPATPAKPKAAAKADKSDSAIAAEIEELRQAMQAQQEQFSQALQAQQEQLTLLKEELAKRDRQIDQARDAAAAANSRATEASSKATEAVNTSVALKSTADTLNTTVANLSASNAVLKSAVETTKQAEAKKADEEGPASIRYKGVTLTPGGYAAAESITRTHATSSDIATPYTGIPFEAADLAHIDETNFSARASRISLLAQSKIGTASLSGYFEADFLGTGTTSNNRQVNGYLFRQRQLFAQAAFENGWIITGGQQWTMATENKKGIFNRQEDLTMAIDANQVVGFTWGRQYGFRAVKDFGGKFAVGVSIEDPQSTIGGRGFSSVTTINSGAAPSVIVTTGATSATTGNFFVNAPGNPAGAYNPFDVNGYTVNKAPDIILKAAADPGFGHYEVFGIVSFFRDRIYPCGVVGTTLNDTVPGTATLTGNCLSPTPTVVSSFGSSNSSSTGGGFGVSGLWSLFNKKLDVGVKGVAGDGIGRYGSAQLIDATARPDGTLALIRTAHGLARAEWHATPKLDIYAYWGLEYAWRAGYSGYDTVTVTKTAAIPVTATSPAIPATTTTKITTGGIGGYGNFAANNSGCATQGVPLNDFNPSAGSNCAGDIRLIQEPTIGFWYRFYQGTKGRLQFGVQYSYLAKVAWSGTGGVPAGDTAISPKGIDNMIFTSFRYYLP